MLVVGMGNSFTISCFIFDIISILLANHKNKLCLQCKYSPVAVLVCDCSEEVFMCECALEMCRLL